MSLSNPATITPINIMNGSQDLNPPVLNVWTEILTVEQINEYPAGIQFHGIEIEQENTEAAAKNVNMRITIRNSDGNLLTMTSTALPLASSTPEIWNLTRIPQAGASPAYNISSDSAKAFEDLGLGIRSNYLKVEVRLEEAAGTAQIIRCRLLYSRGVVG